MEHDAYQRISLFLSAFASPAKEELDQFIDLLKFKAVSKNQKIVSSGIYCNKIFFLADGYVKYELNRNNQQQVIHIAGQGRLVSDFLSFFSGQPAITDIYTITDCAFLVAEKKDLEKLYNQSLVWANFGRKIAEGAVSHQITQRLDIQTLSAEERYMKVLQHHPEILHVVKLGDLAEILGIAQETLSRIRKRVAKGF